MEITLHTIKIRDIVDGFEDNEEEGVVGYGGLLNIRPKYQREFVYNDKQKKEVINSIFKKFPLNVMYWVKNDDDTFELLDGQQRTLSICSFYEDCFYVNLDGKVKSFANLTPDQIKQFLDYDLQIYICENGTDSEKLDWFEIINISGERLTPQELRNAVYSGEWVTALKKKFSKSTCVAYRLAKDYMSGNPIRQDYLQTVLKWISKDNINEYMATHQHDENADIEWQYFQAVIAWVQRIFTKYRSIMKGVEWGELYNMYGSNTYSATDIEKRLSALLIDKDVTNKKGVYAYVLSGDERKLNIRDFDEADRIEAYERQKGICADCGNHFEIGEMHADHITPWSKGGHTTADNCQMLCADCNRHKGAK